MKNHVKTALALAALLTAPALTTAAYAGDWRVGPGPAAVTGMSDVTDLYEKNYNASHNLSVAEVDLILPIGFSVQGTYLWDSGVRLDLGIGPFFIMSSSEDEDNPNSIDPNLDHTEVPVSGTVGYTFARNAPVSPYVRAGFAYHFASGSYVEGSDPGLLAAVGLEFARQSFASFALEIASDQSKVQFERFTRSGPGYRRDTVKLSTYDVVISFLVKF